MSVHELWLRFAGDHPALAGHFPQRPIVPGVLLLDAAVHGLEQAQGGSWRVVSVKFHRPVRPEETVRLGYAAPSNGLIRFEFHAGQELAVSGALCAGRSAQGAV
jgi:3-hydroxymyristoyl/3-hydroxydecanoyl-(acyl carrier protein) dehydratase